MGNILSRKIVGNYYIIVYKSSLNYNTFRRKGYFVSWCGNGTICFKKHLKS